MAKAIVVRYEESAQQPSDGTVQLECYTAYSGEDILDGHALNGIPVIIDQNESIPNIANQIAVAVRAYALGIPNSSEGTGVTIPANNVLILGLSKA